MRVKRASIVTSGEHWSVDLSKAVGSGERMTREDKCRAALGGGWEYDEGFFKALDESKQQDEIKVAGQEKGLGNEKTCRRW